MSNEEEFDEELLRNINLYDTDWEAESVKFSELIEKAKKDPYWFPKKKAKKESKEKKEFSGYNWTTHRKKVKGLKAKVKELKATKIPTVFHHHLGLLGRFQSETVCKQTLFMDHLCAPSPYG